jgi:FtsH-binding integral membrane protein
MVNGVIRRNDRMSDWRTETLPSVGRLEEAGRTFLPRVFGWMGVGLLVTALVAWYVGSDPERVASVFGAGRGVVWILMIAQLGLVVVLSGVVRNLSPGLAGALFLLYSGLTGLTFSVLLLVYTMESIAAAFFASSATFGASAAYGYVTKKDLSSFGSLCFMGLIGIVIASVANFFFRSEGLNRILSYLVVFVFIGLSAWDMQKLKRWHREAGTAEGTPEDRRLAIQGALALYLDFINIFIAILSILGKRR